MKRWLKITLIVSVVVIVVITIVLLVIERQKRNEQEQLDAAEAAIIEKQLPTPDTMLQQRAEVLDPEDNVKEPGDYEPYWGEVDPTHYNLDRIEPTSEKGIQDEVETIVYAYVPILLTYIPGDDPINDSIGVAADYLTPELTEQLVDQHQQNPPTNGVEASIDSLSMTKQNETTYTGTAVISLTSFQLFYDTENENAPEQKEVFGTIRKTYKLEIVKKEQYWYINKLNEQ